MEMTFPIARELVGGQTLSSESRHATFGILFSVADHTLHKLHIVQRITSLILDDKHVTMKELAIEEWTRKKVYVPFLVAACLRHEVM